MKKNQILPALIALLCTSAAQADTLIPIADSTSGRKIASAPGASKASKDAVKNKLDAFKVTNDARKQSAVNSLANIVNGTTRIDQQMKTGVETRHDEVVNGDCYSCSNDKIYVQTNTRDTTDTYNDKRTTTPCAAGFNGFVEESNHIIYTDGVKSSTDNWVWKFELCSQVSTYVATLSCPVNQTGDIKEDHTVTTYTPLSGKANTDIAGAQTNNCVAVFVPPPAPPGGGGPTGFIFGGLGSPVGSATPTNPNITNGTWSAAETSPGVLLVSFSGGLNGIPNLFSGTCTVGVTDAGGGNYALSGCGGSGMADAGGGVSLSFTTPEINGVFVGGWGAGGAGGTVSATVNAGYRLLDLSIGGIIAMDGAGNFNGFAGTTSVSGQCCDGWILYGGKYLAALSAGSFGTVDVSGSKYALGGYINNFFAVGSGGGIAQKAAIMDVATDDPAWIKRFANEGWPAPPAGFNAILSITTMGAYVAGYSTGAGYMFPNGGSSMIFSTP